MAVFWLPWLSFDAPTPRPRPVAEPQSPPPTNEIESPPRPTTTIPILRSVFQPADMAPAQLPPPPAQSPPRTGPQSAFPSLATTTQRRAASPSRATTQRRAASVPPPTTRAVPEPQITPQPASPSWAATQARPALENLSPSRAAPQSRAASVPPSPSRTTSQPQAAVQTPTQPKSSPRLASQTGQTSFPPYSPAKLGTQAPQPSQLEETNPKQEEEITSRTVPKYQTELVQASANVTTATQALEKPLASQNLDSDVLGAPHPAPIFEPGKGVEEKEGKRVVGELKREGIISDEEQKLQKEDIFEKRKTIIGSNGEQMKTTRGRYAPSESHQKPATSNGERVSLHKEIREDISKFVNKLGTGLPKEAIGEKQVSILTLAGENEGAFLHLGTELARKDGSGYIHRGYYKSNPDDTTESTTDGEGSSKGRKPKDPAKARDPVTRAYINSNTQGVNNSILFESSVTEGSPGVQQNISYNLAEPTKQSAKPGPLETHRAEFNIIPAEKHTHEPTVKRPCLRELFVEPRDSYPDNPEKPRRHASRYHCGEVSEDRDIVIL